jgi:hypothetical protein
MHARHLLLPETQQQISHRPALMGKILLQAPLHFINAGLAAFVVALVLAFSTIYDARLFVALQSDVE